MGKLLHKLVRGFNPSWLFTGFRWTNTSSNKKLLHLRLRQGKSSAPAWPSSSAPLNTELVDQLIEMDQSTYYYSESEGEQEQPITGNSNRITSPTIESKHDDGNDDDDDDDDQLHATHNPRMGICALAATSIIKGRWNEDKFEPPCPSREINYPTSPASINLRSHHDDDVHLQNHQEEECLDPPYPIQHQTRKLTRSFRETGVMKGNHYHGHVGRSWQHQHQHQALQDENRQQHHVADGQAHANQHCQHHAGNKPHTNQQSQHHAHDVSFFQHDDPHAHHYHNNHVYKYNHDAGNGSLCMHDDDVYHPAHQYDHTNHVCEYDHHGQTYGGISKECRTKTNMESHPLSSLAKNAKTETQQNNDHHHQSCKQCQNEKCQNDNHYCQHNVSNIVYHQPHLGKFKRKIICLDGVDVKEDGKDEYNHHCSIGAWSCVKRQRKHKGDDVACELPECISEKVGDGCAVVRYSYQNPQFAFWESMMQMIVGNELWDRSELQFLLHCYLALNDPHLHYTIHTTFLQVLKDLQQNKLLWAKVDKMNTISVAGDC